MAKTFRGRHISGTSGRIIKGIAPTSFGRAVADGMMSTVYSTMGSVPPIDRPSTPSNVRASEAVRSSFSRAYQEIKIRG